MPENQPAKIRNKNPKTHVFDLKCLTYDSMSCLKKTLLEFEQPKIIRLFKLYILKENDSLY